VTGKHANAADFESTTSEFLERADNAALSTGDIDFTVAGWVYLESKPGTYMVIASKANAFATGQAEYALYWDNAQDRFAFKICDSSGGSGGVGTVLANNLGAPATGTWYYVAAWHDAAANTVNIQVNNGLVNSSATTGSPVDSS
jgi:hypothetical protein